MQLGYSGGRIERHPRGVCQEVANEIGRDGRFSVKRSAPSSFPVFCAIIHIPRNSGRYFWTGSVIASFPCSISIMMPIETTGFVME